MKRFQLVVFVLFFCTYFVDAGNSQDANKCIFGNDTKENIKSMNEISFLVGQNFSTQKDGFTYSVSICNDVLNQNGFASVTQREYKDVVVLGRRNDSHLIRGDSWIVLSYGSGDLKTEKTGPSHKRKTSIYIVCCPKEHEHKIELVEENGIDYKFILTTNNVCDYNEEMSGMKIILILFATAMSIYCVIGILYNRFIHNAQRCQQIPNFNFWNKIGNSLADACNYICRCGPDTENSWSTITSNFENNDRDDALLRP